MEGYLELKTAGAVRVEVNLQEQLSDHLRFRQEKAAQSVNIRRNAA